MSPVPRLFDSALQRQRLARARQLGPETFLIDRAAEDLSERLEAVQRTFATCLDFGTPGHEAVAVLRARNAAARIRHVSAVEADLEAPALAGEAYDLIVSLLALHHVNDLPGVLAQLRQALVPDGLLLAAVPGGDTLIELRTAFMAAEEELMGGAAPRISPFADVRSLGQLLQRAGLALPVADGERVIVRYADPVGLLRDLRHMGATNVLVERARRPLRRAVLFRAMQIYRERFSDPDGRVRATFEFVWLTGWAPHESQQKPLRPGSAKMKLADALKALTPETGHE
ncbi:MAG: class I SAM-dependent methyltransferase [Proteobacteria bacterium]|nr:class I SAM-dependent methyltransferase [Pseudomonadota bacterium]